MDPSNAQQWKSYVIKHQRQISSPPRKNVKSMVLTFELDPYGAITELEDWAWQKWHEIDQSVGFRDYERGRQYFGVRVKEATGKDKKKRITSYTPPEGRFYLKVFEFIAREKAVINLTVQYAKQKGIDLGQLPVCRWCGKILDRSNQRFCLPKVQDELDHRALYHDTLKRIRRWETPQKRKLRANPGSRKQFQKRRIR